MPITLILGANSDVGKALAHEYARNGYNLYLAARNMDQLDALCSDIKIRYNKEAGAYYFDAGSFESHYGFYHSLPFKPEKVICVFGYLGDTEKGLTNWDEARNIIEVNYSGAVSILNVVASAMMKRKSGTIIGISSVAGERGRQSNFLYGSAKAGFTAYLSGLRNKLFHSHVHVLTVKPGFIRTSMTDGMPLNPKLTASPEQVARSIFKADFRGKNVLYVLWMWRYIMMIIRNIPEGIFKKMKL